MSNSKVDKICFLLCIVRDNRIANCNSIQCAKKSKVYEYDFSD